MADSFSLSKRETSIVAGLKIGLGLFLFWTAFGAFFTSLSSVLLKLGNVHTNWFYLSLNFLSRAWVWVLLTPLIYWGYRRLFYSKGPNSKKVLLALLIGVVVAILHVFVSLNFDVFLRSSLNIIDTNFWEVIVSERPLVLKFIFNSLVTYILLITVFISNDHFGFIKKFAIKRPLRNTTEDPNTMYKSPSTSPFSRQFPSFNGDVPQGVAEKLIVKSEGKILFLDPEKIRCIEAKGNYVLIILQREQIIVRATLKKMGIQLSAVKFIRINRSVIINKDFIKELEPWFHGDYVIRMTEGRQFKTGRAYKNQIKLLLNKISR
jgi:two-component system LytT family response regulator